MERIQQYEVVSNIPLTAVVYKMVLKGDTSWVKPGQFMNITIPEAYLKRPISISDWDDTCITLVYKVVGKGTNYLSKLTCGDSLEALVDLGHGFEVMNQPKTIMVGGGVGVPPLLGTTKALLKQGSEVEVILGFNNKDEIFYEEEFKALGVKVHVATMDGSYGTKGTVCTIIEANGLENVSYMACGPLPMLKALVKTSKAHGQLSFEERMGCGYGACMGCSHKVKDGYKRICKDGPVLKDEEVLWED
ncbi:MAG: dihydroorotate dehydrogenase electron transfer subunit [Erysipelotrichaceae bacterium]|nr:dihydroorotate dehydrogenase electron transfer subunit [Erysipelotrichaceae bacterium]